MWSYKCTAKVNKQIGMLFSKKRLGRKLSVLQLEITELEGKSGMHRYKWGQQDKSKQKT
jgi:hypothetical protein